MHGDEVGFGVTSVKECGFWFSLHYESLKGTKSVVLAGSIRGRAPRTGKDDPFSFG